ncbi:hypothetical protein A2Y47_02245 [Candidatus Giovannonibacteria bacterium RIFCSPLOWO2_12_43_8]|uniref:UDP-N-acetylmuramate--L-alanine ligase n=2 Tax=Candidatus Giovannoniibacteriota TaxID=1752738 RepID=A0A1F5WFC1_9BACT|nr:MAG: hypothetical protein A2W57_02370 [Candidatus Giovannonibacteria bacterium RIFCSPHIGHO2_02_43_16]OGF95682.1 MAG: hypothetical protein A2Y47_02245 [Candidatus Giovannonibacteria bacterium RIFCSPLOWO2_12_43_8]
MNWLNKKIHCVGIKGSGLSGLAILLKNEGAIISGSDTEEAFPSEDELKKNGIEIEIFSEKNITEDIDLVIYSGAWKDHFEMENARRLGIEELSYGEALGEFAKGKKTIVITGTHGKTTTTALLGQIFEAGGLDPCVLTGDMVKAWESSVRLPTGQAGGGKGDYFIVEGDEYQEKFKYFSPVGIIIPSLDYDHPDYFKDKESYQKAFTDWIRANPQAIVVTEPEEADEKIFSKARFIFPGANYKRNALLAIRLSRIFGLDDASIISGINNFKGVRRRLDYYSLASGDLIIIYDYAHHPAEIRSTLKALRGQYPEHKIVAIFQPHTYTRTKVFLGDFARAFSDAQEVYFEEIYASAREKNESIKIEDLINLAKEYHQNAFNFSDFDAKKFFGKLLFVFMGAGDIWRAAEKLSKSLVKR